jgi:hypothetical protein
MKQEKNDKRGEVGRPIAEFDDSRKVWREFTANKGVFFFILLVPNNSFRCEY